MAYFKLIQFGGIAPQVSPRLLADTLAQTASNVNLESQRLTPITDDTVTNPKSDVTTLSNSNRKSVYIGLVNLSHVWAEAVMLLVELYTLTHFLG